MKDALFCDECKDGDTPQKLNRFRGDMASWMHTSFAGTWFCPQCGQIYIMLKKGDPIQRLTIDEYEYQGH